MRKAEIPKNASIVKARWIFKKKLEANGEIRYKSRLVARGFADKNYYDREEIYAPVARLSDVRFILSVSNKFDLQLNQYDVKTAFLNGTLEKTVFMEIPEGLCELGKTKYVNDDINERDYKNKFICKLNKSIYGLKVSPKRWYMRFYKAMQKLRFERYPFQSCLFVWRNKEKFAILLLYVDDILLASNCHEKINETEKSLLREFEISSLGEPKRFLGLEINRDCKNKTIKIPQKLFVDTILNKFNLNDAKSYVSTPMVTTTQETNKQENEIEKLSDDEKLNFPFCQIIGSLLYLQSGSRPDITFSVNVLSRKQSNFEKSDIIELDRILRYLKGTRDYGLLYESDGNAIKCYPDASLGLSDRKGQSTSGYAIFQFNDLISWRTKEQNHIAQSSAEAE